MIWDVENEVVCYFLLLQNIMTKSTYVRKSILKPRLAEGACIKVGKDGSWSPGEEVITVICTQE